MGAYPSTAIQIKADGSPLNDQFLQIGQSLDALTFFTKSQSDATLFDVVANTSSYKDFWSTQTTSSKFSPDAFSYIDKLGHNQPVLWISSSRERDEPPTGELNCGVFPPPGNPNGPLNRLGCHTPAGAPFQYNSGWAICDSIVGYGRNALWMYDTGFFNNAPPPGCTDVSLLVIAAPSS